MAAPALVWVSFEDVAMTFTGEEWWHLDLFLRTLYQEVMLETCKLLVSLGCPVPKAELMCPLEYGQGLWMVKRGLLQHTCTEVVQSTHDVRHGRVAWVKENFMSWMNRKQTAKGAEEGDVFFQVTPPVTYLFQPDPAS
ncbi:zinc finger protein 599 isoform X2 [Fukomys damarensis]|uniref:zinc finger protein 599 isoform X2 n=1 Tax=Fukomys damarensis TaxID=885580 RepID=UPI0014551383|nr:zinc finger protein 599 isoform X2 [Fukomys damarensis]